MIIILGRLDIEPSRLAALKPVFQMAMRRTRAEDGCLCYSIAIEDDGAEGDAGRPATVRIAERWESEANLKAHLATGHMAELNKALAGAIRGADLKVYDATNERPLKLR